MVPGPSSDFVHLAADSHQPFVHLGPLLFDPELEHSGLLCLSGFVVAGP